MLSIMYSYFSHVVYYVLSVVTCCLSCTLSCHMLSIMYSQLSHVIYHVLSVVTCCLSCTLSCHMLSIMYSQLSHVVYHVLSVVTCCLLCTLLCAGCVLPLCCFCSVAMSCVALYMSVAYHEALGQPQPRVCVYDASQCQGSLLSDHYIAYTAAQFILRSTVTKVEHLVHAYSVFSTILTLNIFTQFS